MVEGLWGRGASTNYGGERVDVDVAPCTWGHCPKHPCGDTNFALGAPRTSTAAAKPPHDCREVLAEERPRQRAVGVPRVVHDGGESLLPLPHLLPLLCRDPLGGDAAPRAPADDEVRVVDPCHVLQRGRGGQQHVLHLELGSQHARVLVQPRLVCHVKALVHELQHGPCARPQRSARG